MRKTTEPSLADLRDVIIETWAVNDAMNQLLLEHLDPPAWRAQLPGTRSNRTRTIGAMVAHIHNCRLNWLRLNAPHLKRSAPLDPYRCTLRQASAALKKSAAQCTRMLADALSMSPGRKVKTFSRGWLRPWPAGGAMFAYMFSHEAHHRGQIILLAHQLGYRLPSAAWGGIWNWDRLWKQQGFTTRPR
jgi:uncharacterized damage-inducible protein DinB